MHPARIYVLFMFLFGLGLGMPTTTYVPGLLQMGLSLSDVAFVNMWFWISVVLMELPTGMLADGKSRAWSVRLSALFMAGGSFAYACATGVASAVLAEMTFGVGIAFFSGATQAWATDALAKRGESDRLGAVFGAAAFARSMGMLLGGVIGAGLGLLGMRLGWIGAGIVQFATFILAVMAMNGDDGEPEIRLTEFQAFAASWKALRGSKALVWSVAAAMAFAFVLPFNHYWAPFFKERTGQLGLAGVWIVTYGTCAAGGWYMRRRRTAEGAESRGIFWSLFVGGASLASIGFLPGIAMPLAAVAVHEICRGFFEPLLDLYTQRRVESGYRATYGSLQSLLSRAGFAGVLVIVWMATMDMPSTSATIAAVWMVSGIMLSIAAWTLWTLRPER